LATITKAHHTGLTVKSLERSLAFYRDLLGFEVVFAWNPKAPYIGELVGYPDVDLHAAILRIPNSEVFLELVEYRGVAQVDVDMRNGNVGNAHIAFNVDELGPLYERLKASGVPSVSPPVTPTIGPNRGGRAVYLIDPDGFRVELIETSRSFGQYDPARDASTAADRR
jgi:catechol 2,3-dioxygenase-like lactoylglutathione lyase family enzyme